MTRPQGDDLDAGPSVEGRSVDRMCALAGVSRAAYYRGWTAHAPRQEETALRTLDGVAADAAALPGPEPAALPTLRELLAHVAPEPPPTPPPTHPKTDLRARLAGSGAAVTLQLAPRPAKTPGGLAVRRATGPPRR